MFILFTFLLIYVFNVIKFPVTVVFLGSCKFWCVLPHPFIHVRIRYGVCFALWANPKHLSFKSEPSPFTLTAPFGLSSLKLMFWMYSTHLHLYLSVFIYVHLSYTAESLAPCVLFYLLLLFWYLGSFLPLIFTFMLIPLCSILGFFFLNTDCWLCTVCNIAVSCWPVSAALPYLVSHCSLLCVL